MTEAPEEVPMVRRLAPSTISSLNDGNYQSDEAEFLAAIDRYKREQDRPFPSWSEVLGVIKSLGYAKQKTTEKKASRVPPKG